MSRTSHHHKSTPVRVAHVEHGGHSHIVLYTAETSSAIRGLFGLAANKGQLDWLVVAKLCDSIRTEDFQTERATREP